MTHLLLAFLAGFAAFFRSRPDLALGLIVSVPEIQFGQEKHIAELN